MKQSPSVLFHDRLLLQLLLLLKTDLLRQIRCYLAGTYTKYFHYLSVMLVDGGFGWQPNMTCPTLAELNL